MGLPQSRSFLIVGLVLLTLSAGVNILQAQKIHTLLDAQAPHVSVGRRVETITGFSLAGAPRQVTLRDGVARLVYYFSPTCGWCERNWLNVQALVSGAAGRYRLVLVSSSRAVDSYVRARHLDGIDVVEGIDEGTRQAFGFSGTPHTIMVSGDGLITHDWRGAYTPRTERQIEELFDVPLPGVVPTGK